MLGFFSLLRLYVDLCAERGPSAHFSLQCTKFSGVASFCGIPFAPAFVLLECAQTCAVRARQWDLQSVVKVWCLLHAAECHSPLHPEEAAIISVFIVSLLVWVFWFVFVGNGCSASVWGQPLVGFMRCLLQRYSVPAHGDAAYVPGFLCWVLEGSWRTRMPCTPLWERMSFSYKCLLSPGT